MLRAKRAVPLTATMLAAAILAPAASAQQPTITANGTAQVKPDPANRTNSGSIRKAVDVAHTEALPLAIEDARAHAAELAAAAKLTLGPLLEVSDAQQAGYPFYFLQQNGTFGQGRYCGQVRNSRTVVRNGNRRRVPTKGTHKVCRVPREVVANVQLTFATVAS